MRQRILMRAGRPPHDTTSNEAAFAWLKSGHFASNTGNMLFSDSVYRALSTPDAEIVCDAYLPERQRLSDAQMEYINSEFDMYVMPMANAFRRGYAGRLLGNLTDFVQRLTIPVAVVGVGGQASIEGNIADALPERERSNTAAFARAVLDRSASIGVRGHLTKELLLDLGFGSSDVDVIGCPSMYVNDRDFQVREPVGALDSNSGVVISLESKIDALGDLYKANEVLYPRLTSVYQTMTGIDYILWGVEADGFPEGTPKRVSDPAYVEGRLRYFSNSLTWRRYMAAQDFAFGVRIHGNVSAISAGTPAFMLSVDSRTRELAEFFHIPTAPLAEVMESGKFTADDLYQRADMSELNRALPEKWDAYHGFLEKNGIAHINQPENANPEYRAYLEGRPFPPGAVPLGADTAGLVSRLRWLRQGRSEDHYRPVGGFKPEFSLEPVKLRSAASIAEKAERTTAELLETVRDLRARVSELEAYRADVQQPLERRVARGLKRRINRLKGR